MTVILRYLTVAIVLVVIGCGGSDDSQSANSSNEKTTLAVQDPTGFWDVEFGVLLDDCGLLPEDTARFSDFHTIENSDGVFALYSDVISPAPYIGVMRTHNSFLTEALLEGDIFGDGTFCSLEESMVYNELTEFEAQVLFSLRLACSDGSCETVLRGNAVRGVSILEEIENS